jgi:hypothetical protein
MCCSMLELYVMLSIKVLILHIKMYNVCAMVHHKHSMYKLKIDTLHTKFNVKKNILNIKFTNKLKTSKK